MSLETSPLIHSKSVRQDIDFYKIFKVFFSRWYWIVACVIIALVIGRINLLYSPPQFSTQGQLKLQENNPVISTTQGLASQSYSYTDRIQAEGFVMHSTEVLLNAIGRLDYKVSYFQKGRIRSTEKYPNKPFTIEIIKQDSVEFSRGSYTVEAINRNKFSLFEGENGKKKEYQYGENLNLGNMTFKITSPIPPGVYTFNFNSKKDFLGRATNFQTSEAGRFTNIMMVTLEDQNPAFAADMLNAIMKEYIIYDGKEKKRSARQRVEFIDGLMNLVSKKVDNSGTDLANYKIKNKIVDIGSSSQQSIGKLAQYETKKIELQIEMVGIKALEDQINSNQNKLDPNIGLEGNVSGLLSGLLSQYNGLIATREAKLSSGLLPTTVPVKEIDDQLAKVRSSIKLNIRDLMSRNLKTMGIVNSQIAIANQEISQAPEKEKDGIQKQANFDVNNKVLSYLNEQKIESQMNEAAVVPGATIVNEALPDNRPIAPNERQVYSFAAMVGLACGFGLILLVRFLNPFIYDKETVEALTNTPIIGVIRKFPEYIDKDNRQALSLSKPKSVFAESVRSVRTNLSFLAANKKSKTICITSEISGEGKSFVTVNLAGTLALIDKKVVLIAADLRRSKLHKVFGCDNKVGLSSYLSGQKNLEDVILHDDVHNIDFIPSGPVPPNPSELLHTESMKKLIDTISPLYDYVLIDTAPVGLVSDAIPLIRQSDVNIFVIRSGKSQFRAAAIPERLSREYGLSNWAIVLNAFGDDALHANYYTTDYSRGGGNSTYYYSDYSGYAGSGYYDDPIAWWQFWKKKSKK